MTPVTGTFADLYHILGTGAVIAVVGAALAFGSAHQRLAGVVQLIDMFGIAAVVALAHSEDRLYLVDAKAILILIAYGLMCFRWPDRWLILLTGLQGFAVLLHLSDWLDVSLPRSVNGLFLNVTGWAMLLVLGTATAIHVMNRLDRRDPA